MARVVVTGIGMITSLGNREESWRAIKFGETNSHSIPESFREFGDYRTKTTSSVEKIEEAYEKLKFDRCVKLALQASHESIIDADLELDEINKYRFGIIMGTAMGGTSIVETQLNRLYTYGKRKVHPNTVPTASINSLSGQLAIEYNAKGVNSTISTACSSGSQAIGLGYEKIKEGKADILLVGGSDSSIGDLSFTAFDNLRVMVPDTNECQPFSKNRNGFVLGEGASIITLESLDHALSRGAKIYGEIVGFSNTCDANNMILPDLTGETIYQTMRMALVDSNLDIEDIDYINAHGTGTKSGDLAEGAALKLLLDSRSSQIPISSIKGAIGHTLGASGAIETSISFLAIRDQIYPPTANYREKDPNLDFDFIPDSNRKGSIKRVLKNSYGFGGNNTTLIIQELPFV